MVFEETHRPRPCLDNLARTADGGHNLAANLVAILLYRHNGDAHDDDTARRYMRRLKLLKEFGWFASCFGSHAGKVSNKFSCYTLS